MYKTRFNLPGRPVEMLSLVISEFPMQISNPFHISVLDRSCQYSGQGSEPNESSTLER